jgi:hypothetical protein
MVDAYDHFDEQIHDAFEVEGPRSAIAAIISASVEAGADPEEIRQHLLDILTQLQAEDRDEDIDVLTDVMDKVYGYGRRRPRDA